MKKVVASVVCFVAAAVSLSAAGSNTLRKAPELAFTIPGQGQRLLSQYRGKVVALEFIFTTCPHCQAASRVMTKIQSEYASRGVQILDVAVNENADLLVENFVKDYSVGFPVGYVPSAQMVSFMGWKDARFVVPQLVMIDKEGYIHYQTPPIEDEHWDEMMKESVIRQHLDELLTPVNATKRSPGTSHTAALRKPS